MSTALMLSIMLLGLLAIDLRRVINSGNKKLAWFYSICYVLSFVVIIFNSLGYAIYGPSQLVIDIAKALSLIES